MCDIAICDLWLHQNRAIAEGDRPGPLETSLTGEGASDDKPKIVVHGHIGPVVLDGDLDGDGLEALELTSEGPPGCQPVVTACIDGDGTRIEGHECMRDPRIADGYSMAVTMISASIITTSPAMPDRKKPGRAATALSVSVSP